MTLLEVERLRVELVVDSVVLPAVDEVSFTVSAGECVALVGESGSGKTMTALAIMGLIDPPARIANGDIRLERRSLVGRSESEYRELRGRSVAMVFQDPMTALNPALRIGDQIAEAVLVHDARVSRSAAMARAEELLAQVGVTGAGSTGGGRARDYPHQLSGGMRQRVMLAMALVNRPKLLIADEPTTALDVTTQAQILALVDELRREMGLGVLFITHDLGVVAGLADRVLVMYAGRVVEAAPSGGLFARPRHPYTRGLLASSPRRGVARGALPAIPGQPPSLTDVPAGCAFHPRCAYAEVECRAAVPELQLLEAGHTVACVRVREIPDAVPA